MRPLRSFCPILCLLAFAGGVVDSTSILAKTPAPLPVRKLLPGEPSPADLDRARDLLTRWENESPQKDRRTMRVCYWSPSDRTPQAGHRERLSRVMKHVQAFYLREMAAWGFPGRTIQLDLADDGLLKLHEVQGRLKSEECSETDRDDGRVIREDCLRALRQDGADGEKETIVIFCNLADWDPQKRTISHHSPYYASGDSRGGTAWQVDSPLLDADLLGVKDQHVQDRQYGRVSLGKYNSIFIGGVCHELGHALGLPHCQEDAASRTARGTALMGSGNRTYGDELRGEGPGTFLTLAHALKLAAHPQFSGSVKQIETRADASFSNWLLAPNDDGLRVSGVVQANLPVHAVLAYADPAGGGDYDSQVAAAVPQSDGRFALTLPHSKKRNTPATLHFVAVCVNGAATAGVWSSQADTMNARIRADSTYDVTRAMQKLEFDQQWPAFREKKLAAEILASLNPGVQSIFRRLEAPDSSAGKATPADVPPGTREIALSDLRPVTAVTGWNGPHFDRTADGEPLVGPEGLLSHGLYAHADSVYEYALSGRWETLSGIACLLQRGYGAVVATILGDERVLWQSTILKTGDSSAFSVDVKGVQKLTLRIKATDSIDGAWGAWGEPTLGRANE